MPAYLTPSADGAATLRLQDAQYGISPGQAAVCYIGDRVIGGGWIVSTALEKLSAPISQPQTSTQAA